MKRFKRFGEACPPRIVEALCRAKGRTPLKRLLITFAVICLFGEFASGQTTGANTGPTSFGASDEHEYDSINLATLVPTFHFPVVSKTGAISFGLSIESPQICHIDSVPSWTCGNNGHFADFTPTLTTALWDTTAIYFQTVSGGGTCYTNHVTGLTINGSYHAIPETDIYCPATCASISANVTTSDGSYIKATITSSGTTGVNVTNILLPSGFTSPGSGNGITSWSTSDTFGNVVKEAYSGNPCCSNTYTDTLNASVTYSRTSHNYSYTDTNGSTQNITLTTGSNLTFLPLATQCVPAQSGETVTPFTAINYPDGTSVGITWDPNPRLPGTYSGLIGSITLRTGGTISYTYAEGAIGSCTTPSWNFASLTRTTPDGTTTYSNVGGVTTVLDPGKNKTVYSFAGANPGCSGIYCISVPVIVQIQRYQNTGTVASPVYTLLATDVYCYNGNQTNCTVPSLTFPITQRDVYHTIAGMSTSSRVTETYDTYGNRTSIARYDFGAATFTAKTTTTYGSWNGSACALIGNNVYDHPCDVLTTDGTHTISETRYTYNGNGAQTAKAIWTGSTWLTTTYTPNSNGTVASIQDPNGQQASFGYAPTGSGGCNGLLQTSSSTTVNGVVGSGV